MANDTITLWPHTSIVACVELPSDELSFTLDNGETLVVDHVVLATGYAVDINRVPFLASGNILQALATRPGVVKSRTALMDAAYDDQVYVDDRTIDSHIKRLRKKFKVVDDDFEMIETLYGVGYRFKE